MTNEEFLSLYNSYCLALNDTGAGPKTRYTVINDLLHRSWSRETAHPDAHLEWTRGNAALGQCAVTALVVQDLLGGSILRGEVEGHGSHYANLVTIGEGGYTLDYTWVQFRADIRKVPMTSVSRDRLLHSARAIQAGTPERYVMLRERVAETMRKFIAENPSGR